MQTTEHRDEFVSRSYPIQEDMALQRHGALIASLISLNIGLSLIKRQFPGFGKYMDGEPMLIVEYGKFLEQRARKSRVDVHDILEAARYTQELERLDQVRHPREGRQDPSSPTNEPDLEAARPVASKLAPTKKPKPWRFPVGASLLAIRSPGDAEPVGRISERSEQSARPGSTHATGALLRECTLRDQRSCARFASKLAPTKKPKPWCLSVGASHQATYSPRQ
ncbi:hypothetical protein [Stutzerimonas urumqiensis]|uniref:hypothetical protein n=1 Tax=Stutzerimonas urumqiensis TaxID=638269 RepID=UPI0013CF0A63|nr:hypothetical protein [Stutzerimonas urumqiensis]